MYWNWLNDKKCIENIFAKKCNTTKYIFFKCNLNVMETLQFQTLIITWLLESMGF